MSPSRTPKRGFVPALLTAALLLAAVSAQDAAAQELARFPQAELPRYTVELIVFTYAEGATTGNEIFVPESPPFDEFMTSESAGQPGREVPVFGDSGEPRASIFDDRGEPEDTGQASEPPPMPSAEPVLPGDESSAIDDPANQITGIEHNLNDIPLQARIELLLLPPEQHSMDEIYRKLVKLDAYQPIMRAAWTQTAPGRDEAPSIRLRALGSPPPGLDGTVKLYQGRFVHLGVDLELDAEGLHAGGGIGIDSRSATDRAVAGSISGRDDRYGSAGNESPRPIPVYSDRGYGEESYAEDRGSFPPPVRYRIDEVRIIRDGEIRYYDHPRFGVIAKLTEISGEEPTPETEQ